MHVKKSFALHERWVALLALALDALALTFHYLWSWLALAWRSWSELGFTLLALLSSLPFPPLIPLMQSLCCFGYSRPAFSTQHENV